MINIGKNICMRKYFEMTENIIKIKTIVENLTMGVVFLNAVISHRLLINYFMHRKLSISTAYCLSF